MEILGTLAALLFSAVQQVNAWLEQLPGDAWLAVLAICVIWRIASDIGSVERKIEETNSALFSIGRSLDDIAGKIGDDFYRKETLDRIEMFVEEIRDHTDRIPEIPRWPSDLPRLDGE